MPFFVDQMIIKAVEDYLGITGEINIGQVVVCLTFIATQTRTFIKWFGKSTADAAVSELRLQLVEKNTELHAKELEKLELKLDATKHDTNNLRMSMTLIKMKLQIPLSDREQGEI